MPLGYTQRVMQHGRLTKIAVRATAALAAILMEMAGLCVLERRRTQAELNAVLSAFFSDVVLRDIHESRSGRSIQVIISRDGPPLAYWRARWLNLLLDRRTLFPKASPVTRSSFLLSNAVTTETPAELHLPKGMDFVVLSLDEELSEYPGLNVLPSHKCAAPRPAHTQG